MSSLTDQRAYNQALEATSGCWRAIRCVTKNDMEGSRQLSGSALTATQASQGRAAWRPARQRPQADLSFLIRLSRLLDVRRSAGERRD
jgi:hypothetical protein